MKDLFPAFEKAFPRQRRLMNQLYHACAGYKPFPDQISKAFDDVDIRRLVKIAAHHPRAYRTIIRACYPAICDVSMQEPGPNAEQMLRVATGLTYQTLHAIVINRDLKRLRELVGKESSGDVLRHEVLEAVEGDAMSVAAGRIVLYFLDSTQAVAARLRLDESDMA